MGKIKNYIRYIFTRKNLIFHFGLITFCLSVICSLYPTFVTQYYTNGIYVFIAQVLSSYSSLFKFSLTDSAFIAIIILVIISLASIIYKRKNIKRIGLVLLKFTTGIYIAFYWLWGFNYYASNIYDRGLISPISPSQDDFIETLNYLISETNSTRVEFDEFDELQIDSLIELSYSKNANFLKLNYPLGNRQTKNIIMSRYYSGAGILGYFMPFFNEVHLNKNLLPIEYPAVLAHEKAHQFGITSEAEANFIAWYVCSTSDSKQLKYSINIHLLRYFFQQLNRMDSTGFEILELSSEVIKDIEIRKTHWKSLRIKSIDHFNGWLYNKYLNINKVPGGINNYNEVVKLIIQYRNQDIVN